MPRFVQFLQHSGMYAEQDFMIVPRPGFNLVCLRDSKDVRLSYDSRLQVVGFEDVERVALEYSLTRSAARGTSMDGMESPWTTTEARSFERRAT